MGFGSARARCPPCSRIGRTRDAGGHSPGGRRPGRSSAGTRKPEDSHEGCRADSRPSPRFAGRGPRPALRRPRTDRRDTTPAAGAARPLQDGRLGPEACGRRNPSPAAPPLRRAPLPVGDTADRRCSAPCRPRLARRAASAAPGRRPRGRSVRRCERSRTTTPRRARAAARGEAAPRRPTSALRPRQRGRTQPGRAAVG